MKTMEENREIEIVEVTCQDGLEVIEGEIISEEILPLQKKTISLRWMILITTCLFIFSTVLTFALLPLFTISPQVIITPSEKTVTSTLLLSLPIVRTLGLTTFKASMSVVTTGVGHQQAISSQGLITFYNAAPYSQSIGAGTILTGADGKSIVTDSTAYIPAAYPPIEGQVSVFAHSLTTGESSNISAYDINGECCSVNIFVKNLMSFTGGRDTRSFHIVSTKDVQSTSTTLQLTLFKEAQKTLARHIAQNEGSTPPLCSHVAGSDHAVGDEATHVEVSLVSVCTSSIYDLTALKNDVQKASTISHYDISGVPQTTILQSKANKGAVLLSVQVISHMVYHFTQQDIQRIVRDVEGKNILQAKKVLSQEDGVQHFSYKLPWIATSFPWNITVFVLKREN